MKNKDYYELMNEELNAARYTVQKIIAGLGRYDEAESIVSALIETDELAQEYCIQLDKYLKS